jgi:hypothetical protein
MKHLKTFESYSLNEELFGLGLSKEDRQIKGDLAKGPLSPEVYKQLIEVGKKAIITDPGEANNYKTARRDSGEDKANKYAVFIALRNKKIIDAGKYSAWNPKAIAPDGTEGFFGNGSKFGEVGANQ